MSRVKASFVTLPSGREMTIRNPEPEDAAELLKILNGVIDEELFLLLAPGELTNTVQQEMNWINRQNESEKDLFLVGEIDGELVGGVSFTRDKTIRRQHTGLIGLFVVKHWRQHGVGTALLQTMIQWARNHPEIEKLSLEVFESNQAAIRLYRKLGFVQEGLLKNNVRLGWDGYDSEWVMALFVK